MSLLWGVFLGSVATCSGLRAQESGPSRQEALEAFTRLMLPEPDGQPKMNEPVDLDDEAFRVVEYMQTHSKSKLKPFILLSQQRSGSHWLNLMLNSHPQIVIKGEYLPSVHPQSPTDLKSSFEEMELDVRRKENVSRLGFILHTNHALSKGACGLEEGCISKGGFNVHKDMVWIALFRRNVLRKIIADQAHRHYEVHVVPVPTLDEVGVIHRLQKMIQNIFELRIKVLNMLSKSGESPCKVGHYEDLVHSDALFNQTMHEYLSCLGVEDRVLSSEEENSEWLGNLGKPINETATNFDRVVSMLTGTQWEYMLEQYPTADAIYDHLKASDTFEQPQ